MNEEIVKKLLNKYGIFGSKSTEDIIEVLEIKCDALLERYNRTKEEDLNDSVDEIQNLIEYLQKNQVVMEQLLTEMNPEQETANAVNVDALKGNASVRPAASVIGSTSLNSVQPVQQNVAPIPQPAVAAPRDFWFTSLNGDNTVNNLFIQAEDCLKYGQWDQANRVFESIIAAEPKNPGIFLGKVLAKYKIQTPKDIAQNTDKDLENDVNFRKARDFSNKQQSKYLQDMITERRNFMAYCEAAMCASKNSVSELKRAAAIYESISTYRDAAIKATECRRRAQETEDQEKEQERKNRNVELMRSLLTQFNNIPVTDSDGMQRMAEDIKKLREESPETRGVASEKVMTGVVEKRLKEAEQRKKEIKKNESEVRLVNLIGLAAAIYYILRTIIPYFRIFYTEFSNVF